MIHVRRFKTINQIFGIAIFAEKILLTQFGGQTLIIYWNPQSCMNEWATQL